MTKLVEIENCLLCPHEERTPDGYFCTKMNNRKIESIIKIPDWCPLPSLEKRGSPTHGCWPQAGCDY